MARTSGPELAEWDDEWLVVRGNYLTLITPELAARFLADHNEGNRKLKKRAIAQYARDMAAGKWNPDSSDIKFDRTRRLVDGQNRLAACVEAGKPFPTLVRTGVDSAARDHVDTGVKRTVSDTFLMHGVINHTNIAAAVSLRARYEAGMASPTGGRLNSSERRQPLTTQESLDYLAAHPAVEKMHRDATAMHSVGPAIARSVYFAFLSMAAESNEAEARKFASDFVSGTSTGTGDPLLALTRFIAVAKSPTQLGKRDRAQAEKHLLALIRAWNAWRTGTPLERIVVRDNDLLEPAV